MVAKRRCGVAHPTTTFKAPGVEAPYRCILEAEHESPHKAVYKVTDETPEGIPIWWED